MNPKYKKTRNYIVYTQNYSIIQYHGILRSFAKEMNVNKPKEVTIKWYYIIGELAQDNWSKFMTCYGRIKKNYKRKFKVNKKQNNKASYDQWYEEASMDGSLAYNGSADDF